MQSMWRFRIQNLVGARKLVALGWKNIVGARNHFAFGGISIVGARKHVALGGQTIVGARNHVALGGKNIVGARKHVPLGGKNIVLVNFILKSARQILSSSRCYLWGHYKLTAPNQHPISERRSLSLQNVSYFLSKKTLGLNCSYRRTYYPVKQTFWG